MGWRNSPQHFGMVSKIFHWGLAAFLIGMLVFGTYLGGLRFTLANLYLFDIHKSLGILAFTLILARLIWTVISRPPPPRTDPIARGRLIVAKVTHIGMYTCMIAMPLTGWIASSAAVFDMRFFDLMPIADLVATDPDVEKLFFRIHGIISYIFIALIALHLAGALVRHFVKRDDTLRRMWF